MLSCDADKTSCEVEGKTDKQNCGECGKECFDFAGGTAACKESRCAVDTCDKGTADCDQSLRNGCEVNTASDSKNCGACGNVCPDSTPFCRDGACIAADISGNAICYESEGRRVWIFKSAQCADLTLDENRNFCENRGLLWWKPHSDSDAQLLVSTADDLINKSAPLWIVVKGVSTDMNTSTVDGYKINVNSGGCEGSSAGGADDFSSFRRWSCSFCDPENNPYTPGRSLSCCWDSSNENDWFACEL